MAHTMTNMHQTSPLVCLLSTLDSSLSMYVADAGIWSYSGAEEIKLALADLVGDQRSIMERAGTLLVEQGGLAPRHTYPIRFTATAATPALLTPLSSPGAAGAPDAAIAGSACGDASR